MNYGSSLNIIIDKLYDLRFFQKHRIFSNSNFCVCVLDTYINLDKCLTLDGDNM